jgi:hypothetical protein
MLVREILEIADDTSGDISVIKNEDGSTYEKVNQEVVNRAKLRVDARKGIAARLAPKKWGDRLAHEHAGADGQPIPPVGGVVILEVHTYFRQRFHLPMRLPIDCGRVQRSPIKSRRCACRAQHCGECSSAARIWRKMASPGCH